MEEAIHNSCVASARHNAEHLSSNNGNGGISYVLPNAHARSLRGEFKGQSRQSESHRRGIVALLNRPNMIGRCVQCDEELWIEHGTL